MRRFSSGVTFAAAALLLALAACSSTRQIEAGAPQPAVEAGDDDDAAPRAALSVVLETGETPLPDAVHTLRFRVSELRLRQPDGTWIPYPADVNTVVVARGADGPARKTLLSTRVPALAYDSLALVLEDVYVEYGPDAGGPLTRPRGRPVTLPLALRLSVGAAARLRVVFEPGASLSRTDDCRWFFVPFLEAAAPPQP